MMTTFPPASENGTSNLHTNSGVSEFIHRHKWYPRKYVNTLYKFDNAHFINPEANCLDSSFELLSGRVMFLSFADMP